MRQQRSKTLALAIVFVLFAFSFVTTASARQRQSTSPQDIYKEMVLQLEELEQRSPQNQVAVFKLRDNLSKLYSHISGDLTDPFKSGRPTVPDLANGSDLYDSCTGLKDDRLKDALLDVVRNHVSVGYQRAQDLVFSDIDNKDGYVECVYTGRKLKTSSEPSATNMNLEHSWPQSMGAVGIAKCDLHHLFPTDSKANGIRGNNPFGDVDNAAWEEGGSKTDKSVFEVRPEQRGDTARGMFYFAIRYDKSIDPKQEATLKRWHQEDPVDSKEKKRNDRVQNFQNNRNPFVDKPEFVNMISDF
ncbi:MAG: endonuclease [Candidatus Riflebacteria bacterium]|nr:endonuclease [Candidatus Riflebacteria bacterium]